MRDTALQPHIIVFTNGSSDQHLPSVDLDDKLVMTFGNLPVRKYIENLYLLFVFIFDRDSLIAI